MCKLNQFPTLITRDGMAVIGRTPHNLRGIRYVEGEGGGDGGDGGEGGGDGEGADKDKDLGDAGQKALERMKERERTSRAEAKAYKDLGLTPDEIKALIDARDQANAPDEEKIRKAAQRDAETAARDKFAGKLRASEVRAQAAELGFASPSDALALLPGDELAAVDVSEDDEVDAGEIKKLLEQLKTAKPYLLKPTDTTADHQTAGIGAAGSGKKPEVQPGLARMRSAYENSPKK
jgi:DNA-binding transcriptional MerR regulator